MTDKLANFLTSQASELDRAKLYQNTTQRPFHFQLITLLLDQVTSPGAPLKIGFPFKGLTVISTSDSNTVVNAQFGGQDAINPLIPLKQNNTLNFDEPMNECYLSWGTQPGKSMSLLFAIDCVMSIGVATTAITGGIFQQDGTAVAPIASVSLAAGVAAIIIPSLSTRKHCTAVNNTGATLYIGGDPTVTADATATGGIPIPPGGLIVWKNTAPLYGISAGGGLVNRLEES